MGQTSMMMEPEYHICYNCEAEFSVSPVYEENDTVMFCPYCGSELEGEEIEDDVDDEDNRY